MDNELEHDGQELTRNAAQKVAMTAIYDALTYRKMGMRVDVEEIVSSLLEKPYAECDWFVKGAVIFALKHEEEAVARYQEHMRKWLFSRLNRVEQAILLLSYVHFYFLEPEIDKAVVINIAVRLAKEYLSDKDYKFVNAILDKVLVR